MTQTRIRLSPPESPAPHPAPLPLEGARRWLSPHEEVGQVPPIFVFVAQSAYVRAVVHAASRPDYEVGGVLVGRWCADGDSSRQFVVVTAALPARFTRQGSVFLTFTQDTLVDLHAKIEEHHPGQAIVGWYHTHPRMGVFLSHYDTWLHRHFFPEPWQVALVVEPHSAAGGFFIRQPDGGLDPEIYFGFHELDGDTGRSVVHLNNLRQDPEADRQEGVRLDE